MILATDRPVTNRERLADWYARASHTGYPLVLGPRFGADFGATFRREYEAEQIADGRAGFDEGVTP